MCNLKFSFILILILILCTTINAFAVNINESFEGTYITKERLDERLGLCYFFHSDANIMEGWSTLGGDKYVYVDQTETDGDWTHYVVAEQAPVGATGISVRARFTSNP